ncbi:MAG: DUF983 domain-containing protein [Hyphomicrobiaceae bacterium]|nr:DUF983 domain-containing protein [Hyphomicrobiaceae bacterium]MCC0007487.1 DUF983 domain-containing protein [Hyphomicrobiaceae bacterium]
MTSIHQKPTASPVALALKARCPRCGEGPLFHQVLNLRERCDSCGLDYKFIDTGDGPAVFAIFILGFVVLGGALWVQLTYDTPMLLTVALSGVVTLALALGLLRFLKALLIALQYKNKAEEGRLAKGD